MRSGTITGREFPEEAWTTFGVPTRGTNAAPGRLRQESVPAWTRTRAWTFAGSDALHYTTGTIC